MTINYVKRYADKLSEKNDITNFNASFSSLEGISAVSWESPGCSRREYGEKLLKDMFASTTDNRSDHIYVIVQLVPEQPDTAIVNYKKTWGLIKNSGVSTDSFSDKKSYIDKGSKGLVLTGVGCIPYAVNNEMQKLINCEEKLFFSNIAPDLNVEVNTHTDRLTQWIYNIFSNDGVVFFLLGSFNEMDSEVVALGSKSALKKIYAY